MITQFLFLGSEVLKKGKVAPSENTDKTIDASNILGTSNSASDLKASVQVAQIQPISRNGDASIVPKLSSVNSLTIASTKPTVKPKRIRKTEAVLSVKSKFSV